MFTFYSIQHNLQCSVHSAAAHRCIVDKLFFQFQFEVMNLWILCQRVVRVLRINT